MELTNPAEFILPWFKMSEIDILQKFYEDCGHKGDVCGDGDYASLFIPGTRKDRALLVAHVDTVWNDSPKIDPVFLNGLFVSKARVRGISKKEERPVCAGFGIGADDRAGIAMLYYLKDLGHSILLTNCEEQGCLGTLTRMADSKCAQEIQEHQFAIEFDRNGRNDLVFYDVSTPEFETWCIANTYGYRKKEGSSSDIAFLCERICGVNISVGYRNEHSVNEVLVLNWWLRTLITVNKWLSQEDLPKFERK